MLAKKPVNKKAFIISSLRRCSFRWPGRTEALLKARAKQLERRGRMVWHYRCVECVSNVLHPAKGVRVDHIDPVVPLSGFPMLPGGREDWGEYIDRLFCDASGFQILCLEHHKTKTTEEIAIRKAHRQVSKNMQPKKAKRRPHVANRSKK